MELESYYDIDRTADFIHSRNLSKVALQFPDQLLKDSTRVVTALRHKLRSLKDSHISRNGDEDEVRLFVIADTTYGSCCVDEVAALHADADCVIHYGHTCLSPTTTLPALFVLGKASISLPNCVNSLSNYFSTNTKPVLVLFGLEYAHSVYHIKEALAKSFGLCVSREKSEIYIADVMCSVMNPVNDHRNSDMHQQQIGGYTDDKSLGKRYSIGGLVWFLPEEHKMEDYLLFWIGSENSAFANVVLTFNGCEIVRYDAKENNLVTDFSQQRRILKRRYYLVEKAKDASIVGILVGTLGSAGYLNMIHQMKELITEAGKKAYMLVMGRPNPAKLANFPECDVFIYVSCAETALLDCKEYLAPVLTPFEAMLAFNRGSQWTGAYIMEFQDLINSSLVGERNQQEEARYSFLQGGYVEDFDVHENDGESKGALALLGTMEKALQLRDNPNQVIKKGKARSGAEFFAARSYHGLDIHNDNSMPEPFFIGRTGRASGYDDEKVRQEH